MLNLRVRSSISSRNQWTHAALIKRRFAFCVSACRTSTSHILPYTINCRANEGIYKQHVYLSKAEELFRSYLIEVLLRYLKVWRKK